MRYNKLIAGVALMGTLAACQNGPVSVADYCANPDKGNDKVCQLHVDIEGTRTALADTDMKLSEARTLADSAFAAAERAQAGADTAQATANEARAMASSALSSVDNLYCETNTIRQTNTGSCPANFKLVSCSQTRYTTRAGGLSFLREINDETCRFNSQVLEMQVRCCTVASASQPANYSTPVTYRSN